MKDFAVVFNYQINVYLHDKTAFLLSAFIFSLQTLYAQSSGSIKGTVTTSDNKPAAAVTVHIKEPINQRLPTIKETFVSKILLFQLIYLGVSLVGYADVDQRVTVSSNEEARGKHSAAGYRQYFAGSCNIQRNQQIFEKGKRVCCAFAANKS